MAIYLIYGGLTGVSAKIFEGTVAITATFVLSYMIFWMAKNAQKIKGELQEKVGIAITRGYLIGISILAFVAVAREGLETVLFLTAFAFNDPIATTIGSGLGAIVVIGITVLMMKGIYKLNIRKFFKYTSIILLVFAAGLFGYGVHEFIEVAEESVMSLGFLSSTAYNINPSDINNPFHEKGIIGSILKALVGYDGNPEWLRVFSYIGYWVIIGIYLIRVYSPSSLSKIKAKFLSVK